MKEEPTGTVGMDDAPLSRTEARLLQEVRARKEFASLYLALDLYSDCLRLGELRIADLEKFVCNIPSPTGHASCILAFTRIINSFALPRMSLGKSLPEFFASVHEAVLDYVPDNTPADDPDATWEGMSLSERLDLLMSLVSFAAPHLPREDFNPDAPSDDDLRAGLFPLADDASCEVYFFFDRGCRMYRQHREGARGDASVLLKAPAKSRCHEGWETLTLGSQEELEELHTAIMANKTRTKLDRAFLSSYQLIMDHYENLEAEKEERRIAQEEREARAARIAAGETGEAEAEADTGPADHTRRSLRLRSRRAASEEEHRVEVEAVGGERAMRMMKREQRIREAEEARRLAAEKEAARAAKAAMIKARPVVKRKPRPAPRVVPAVAQRPRRTPKKPDRIMGDDFITEI